MALEKLKSASLPPDGLLILADRFTESALECFPQIQAYGTIEEKAVSGGLFGSRKRAGGFARIRGTRYGATAYQPATLREIRVHFRAGKRDLEGPNDTGRPDDLDRPSQTTCYARLATLGLMR